MAVGLLSDLYRPLDYYGTVRPESEAVVIPTYRDLEAADGALAGALDALRENPTDATLSDLGTEYVNGLDGTLKGFHTIEYLLFDEAAARRRRTSPGASSTTSWQRQRRLPLTAVRGPGDHGKIAHPFSEQDPRLVESQFSFDSLDDFQNNMRSVWNAYTGDYGGREGPGLDEFVALRNDGDGGPSGPEPGLDSDKALSGGAATVFDAASTAFENPVSSLGAGGMARFLSGDAAFEAVFVSAPAEVNGGLGPVFNQTSCAGCHGRDGRGRSGFGATAPFIGSSLMRVSLPGVGSER